MNTSWQRFTPVLAAVVIGLALFGFLSGIREPKQPARAVAAEQVAGPAPASVAYPAFPHAGLRANDHWKQSLQQLQYARPGMFEPVVRTEEMRQVALADRSRNRAYDGAPPTIPHPVEARSARACLACHGAGLKVGERIASKMSHPLMTNCTQCHVEQTPTDSPENGFVGVYRAGPGQRAGPGAPPTIPHSTWLRQDCTSCHGLVTRAGTRTTHPWLTNCTQCHAPSAALDQVDFMGGRP